MWSCDQSFVTLAFQPERLSYPQFHKDSTRKTTFFEKWWSGFKFNNVRLTLGMNLKSYISVEKGLRLKVRKLFGANSYVCRSYSGETGRGLF